VTAPFIARVLQGYREIGARAGFLALLVALSAALGALIAFPLWLFATASPRAYTVAVIAAGAAAAGAALVRRLLRTGISRPRAAAKALALLAGLAKAALLLAGLFAAAASAARRLSLPAAAAGLVVLAAAAWIGWGVKTGTPRKPRETIR